MSARRKPFIEGDAATVQRVGSRYVSDGSLGPVAEVYFDENWLHIVTDDYEGSAVLGIETLPLLRRALARVAKAQKAGREAVSDTDTVRVTDE